MELLEGETLKARWIEHGSRMPVAQVLDIADAILDVLAAAHERGVVHRDVKPENVFLLRDRPIDDGGLKLLDFGIAGLAGCITELTTAGVMLGTPAFMSPEQARGDWGRVDARSDLYSLGATVWTLLTGRLVHQASSVVELLVANVTKQAPPFRSVTTEVPEAIAGWIDRAVAFDPTSRFSDAAAMRRALAEARKPTDTPTRHARVVEVRTVPMMAMAPHWTPGQQGHTPQTMPWEATPSSPQALRHAETMALPSVADRPSPLPFRVETMSPLSNEGAASRDSWPSKRTHPGLVYPTGATTVGRTRSAPLLGLLGALTLASFIAAVLAFVNRTQAPVEPRVGIVSSAEVPSPPSRETPPSSARAEPSAPPIEIVAPPTPSQAAQPVPPHSAKPQGALPSPPAVRTPAPRPTEPLPPVPSCRLAWPPPPDCPPASKPEIDPGY
jgi:serine/threonine-protein kinase